jgi:VCBS repeat-containing protein
VDSNVATVAITINAVNDAPVAVNDSYSVNEDNMLNIAAPGVLANDTDVEGNTLTAALVTGPAFGTLTLNSNGSFTYTPNANFNGTDSFTYRANDGAANSNTATVTITVNAVNDAPVANPDTYTTNENTALTIAAPGVLANDTDIEGNPLTAVLVAGPVSGTLTLNSNGSFTYTPNAGFSGVDTFTYRATDGTNVSAPVVVTITVVPSTEELSTISGLVYKDANNNGSVDFGETAIAGVTIHLTGVNDMGVAVNLTTTTDADGVYMFVNLRAGVYTVSEDQPSGYTDGIDSLGTVNGITTGDNSVNDTFSGIVITEPGSVAENYNFGETLIGQPIQSGQTGTVGYWQNNNGQALLRSLNGGPDSTALGDWLAATFSNIWGANAGANNLAGKTNAEVADFYSTLFTRTKKQTAQLGLGGPVGMDAQVMAVAFAVYVTDSDLAGTAAVSYGFTVNSFGTGASTFNVGNNGAAFDLANGTQATILDLLLAANNHAYLGILYDEDHDGDATSSIEVTFRAMANVVFSGINQTGDVLSL